MENKEKYIDALKRISIAYYHLDDSTNTKDRFREDLKLLATFVKEYFKQNECQKQVQNRETNLGHYEQKIIDTCFNFAVVNGEFKSCLECSCGECSFYNNGRSCLENKLHWSLAKYQPKYKLTRFEYDLVHTYSDCHAHCKFSDCKQLRELKDKGYFKCVNYDTKVNDILANCEVVTDEKC